MAGRQIAGRQRTTALFLAAVVTLLWSSSYVLIKIGLLNLPPSTFAGLRYFTAFGALLAAHVLRRQPMPRALGAPTWRALIGLGLTH